MVGVRAMAYLAAGLLVGAGTATGQSVPSAEQLKREAFSLIDANAERMGRMGDAIFSYSEIGQPEPSIIAFHSAKP